MKTGELNPQSNGKGPFLGVTNPELRSGSYQKLFLAVTIGTHPDGDG